jgi:crossover junction endodeoxyribonuclease RuvC
MSKLVRILGVDPGSRCTGYGVIDADATTARCIDAGVIRLDGESMPARLHGIFDSLREVIERGQPEVLAVEQVFMHRNAASALKLGQARGAVICAAAQRRLVVHEYAPRAVKQAVVGSGAADKAQVQHMVRILLALQGELAEDAADALAVALCHSHTQTTLSRIGVTRGARAGRWW